MDQGEVAGVVEQSVGVQGQNLQRLQVAERVVLDVVDQVPVEVELSQTCKLLHDLNQYPHKSVFRS